MSRNLEKFLGDIPLTDFETIYGPPQEDFSSLNGIILGEDDAEEGGGSVSLSTPTAYWDFTLNFQDVVGARVLTDVGGSSGVVIAPAGFLENGAQFPLGATGTALMGAALPDSTENLIVSFWVKDITPDGNEAAHVHIRHSSLAETIEVPLPSMPALYDGNWHMISVVIQVLGDTSAQADFYVDAVHTGEFVSIPTFGTGQDIQIAMGSTAGLISELAVWSDLSPTVISEITTFLAVLYTAVWRSDAWQVLTP